jgi:hypothetical protein
MVWRLLLILIGDIIMPIVINGSGTITGISVGGLPDDIVDAGMMADNSIDSDAYVDASIDNAHLADDAVGVAELSATGTASSSTFLRGDNSWQTVSTPITALNNATNNELVTVGSTTTELDGEANLTFDGNQLVVTGTTTPSFSAIKTDSGTTGHGETASFARTTSGDMADTYGGAIQLKIGDATQAAQGIAAIDWEREGADNSGKLFLYTRDAGTWNNGLLIDKKGWVTQPRTRAGAFRTTVGTNTSYSANAIVIYNAMDNNDQTYNYKSCYNTSTGKYTAPVTGLYTFNACAMTTGWSNGSSTQDLLQFHSNNRHLTYGFVRRSQFRSDAFANGYYAEATMVETFLDAGDTVFLKVSTACGISNTQYSWFSGHLVA